MPEKPQEEKYDVQLKDFMDSGDLTDQELELLSEVDGDIGYAETEDEGRVTQARDGEEEDAEDEDAEEADDEAPRATKKARAKGEDLSELEAAAELGRKWEQAFATDAAGTMKLLYEKLPPELQRQFQEVAGIRGAAAEEDAEAEDEDFSGLTPQERLVEQHRDWLQNGKTHLEQTIAQAHSWRDEIYGAAALETHVQGVLLEAVLEMVGIEAPEFDRSAIWQQVAKGKALADAVRDTLSKKMKKALLQATRREEDIPRTPGQRSGQRGPRKGANLREIFFDLPV